MPSVRNIFILGASCSGVSTLGSVLAGRLEIAHIDVDDFYWVPTDPPFSVKRTPEDRVKLIAGQQAVCDGWVLTGSLIGWGEKLSREADLIVFIYTPTAIRLQRLDRREAARHGDRILPGGDMHEAHLAFRKWASGYDDPQFTGRSLAQHERWLRSQLTRVVRLCGDTSTDEMANAVMREIALIESVATS